MNQKELIEKINAIETYDELIEMNKFLRNELLSKGFECFENFHEIYKCEHDKHIDLQKKFNVIPVKFKYY